MKRTLVIVSLALLVTGTAFAQAPRAVTRWSVQPDTVAMGIHTLRAMHQELVAALGVTPLELRLFAADGKSVAEVAAELGVDVTALTARLAEARNAAIDDAVAAERLSEDVAATLKAQSEAVAQALVQQSLTAVVGPHGRLARLPSFAPARPLFRGPAWSR
jgi:transposase-like protein